MICLAHLLQFFNENAGALTAFFTMVVAVSTVVYAILTYSLVKETKRLREAQTQPKLSINTKQLEGSPNFIDLIIENIGAGPAYNIKFNVQTDFKTVTDKLLSELNIFRNGLNYLGPRQSVQFFIANSIETNFKDKIINPIVIDLTYFDAVKKEHKDSFRIDFRFLEGLAFLLTVPPAKSLEEIEKNTKRIADELKNFCQR